MDNNLSESDRQLLLRIGADRIAQRAKIQQRRNFRTALAFMAPAIILVCGLLLYPVLFNVYLSFTNWRKFQGFDEFVGLANYERLSGQIYFLEAATNTILWVVVSLILPVVLGLGIAVLMHRARFSDFFKCVIFLPRVLAPTAVGVIWYYVYSPHGLLNTIMSFFTGSQIDTGWLYQDNTVTPAIIATHVWQTVGLVMVLLLIGLAAIPRDPLEAAQMDGASGYQTFRYIVLPLLLPTLVVVAILSVLSGFTAFDLLWVMGSNYPNQRTLSLVVYMYFEAFQKGSWAFGGTIAVVLGLIVLAVTWVQTLLQSKAEKITR